MSHRILYLAHPKTEVLTNLRALISTLEQVLVFTAHVPDITRGLGEIVIFDADACAPVDLLSWLVDVDPHTTVRLCGDSRALGYLLPFVSETVIGSAKCQKEDCPIRTSSCSGYCCHEHETTAAVVTGETPIPVIKTIAMTPLPVWLRLVSSETQYTILARWEEGKAKDVKPVVGATVDEAWSKLRTLLAARNGIHRSIRWFIDPKDGWQDFSSRMLVDETLETTELTYLFPLSQARPTEGSSASSLTHFGKSK